MVPILCRSHCRCSQEYYFNHLLGRILWFIKNFGIFSFYPKNNSVLNQLLFD
jgi:hypothetical protein